MDGYEVDVEGLRKAARAAGSAGEQAGQVKLGEAVRPVGAAMPGSAAAGRAQALAEAWDERLRAWSADIATFSGNLGTSADGYQRNEDAAKADFGGIGALLDSLGGGG
ncbi:hypothetical protein [Actinokineospora bangkokensis]|uniref:WXG100 family type VII secretion target n=1 Tax=Actinokineospora bangkokensis TaxID=1193682 RepID=A0A1Q9LHD1_9PSEU|nr:hypothetical protein [Actinokineospora bangkokensis]OLR91425.1 hypothetical protein BJP25_00890 [Actinokineospora bangkokensis]